MPASNLLRLPGPVTDPLTVSTVPGSGNPQHAVIGTERDGSAGVERLAGVEPAPVQSYVVGEVAQAGVVRDSQIPLVDVDGGGEGAGGAAREGLEAGAVHGQRSGADDRPGKRGVGRVAEGQRSATAQGNGSTRAAAATGAPIVAWCPLTLNSAPAAFASVTGVGKENRLSAVRAKVPPLTVVMPE